MVRTLPSLKGVLTVLKFSVYATRVANLVRKPERAGGTLVKAIRASPRNDFI